MGRGDVVTQGCDDAAEGMRGLGCKELGMQRCLDLRMQVCGPRDAAVRGCRNVMKCDAMCGDLNWTYGDAGTPGPRNACMRTWDVVMRGHCDPLLRDYSDMGAQVRGMWGGVMREREDA